MRYFSLAGQPAFSHKLDPFRTLHQAPFQRQISRCTGHSCFHVGYLVLGRSSHLSRSVLVVFERPLESAAETSSSSNVLDAHAETSGMICDGERTSVLIPEASID